MNTLYEYGNSANVLIKPIVDMYIGNKLYKANEPYTILKDVRVNLLYEQINSTISGKKPISSSQSARPTQIAINDIPLTEKICNLIFTKEQQTIYTHTVNEHIIAEDNKLYLNSNPVNDNIFIYDNSFAAIDDYTIEDNIINGNFINNEYYLVFYEIEDSCIKYNLEIPQYPYFIFEVTFNGNNNKNTSYLYMKFPAVSIITVPNFNNINNGIFNTPLICDIIYNRQEQPIFIMR